MPVASTLGARLAASLSRFLHSPRAERGRIHGADAMWASEAPRQERADAMWASEAPSKKSSRVGPLIAFEHLRQPVWTPRDYSAFATEGFMQNAIVYRSVRMISECVGVVPLLLYQGSVEIERHPLLDLIRRPNSHETWPDFIQRVVGYLLVSGNAYIEAVAIDRADAGWASGAPRTSADAGWASGAPRTSADAAWASGAPRTSADAAWASGAQPTSQVRELYALRPDRIKVVPGPDGWPEAYDYTVDGRTVRISGEATAGVRSILHIKLFHPTNDYYGASPLEAAAAAIDLHNTASRWNKALLDNSARPSGAIVYTAREGNLTAEQIERLKSELEDGFQGSANAGRPLLLEGGLDWKAMSLSPKDMDFIEARHVAAREIALALGVPPMLLGIPGDNTYANLAEAQRTFWRQTVLPLAERLARSFSEWLLAPEPGSELRLDTDALPALAPERDALWSSLESTSFLTTDEKRALAGFSPLPPGADAKWASEAPERRFNPHHDAIGRFTTADGATNGDRANFTLVGARGRSSVAVRVGNRALDATPAQGARFAIANARAEAATEQVREIEPNWRPTPSLTDPNNIESHIARAESDAREAEARLAELSRSGVGGNNGPPLDPIDPRSSTGVGSVAPREAIDSYRSITGMPELGTGLARSWSDGTVAYTQIDGKPIFGVNSDAPGYTVRDEAMAKDMRERLIQEYPEDMATKNSGHKPNDALFHAEANALLRAAEPFNGSLAGRTIEMKVDRSLCYSCEAVLPYLGMQLGNPTVTIVDGSNGIWTMRDGTWTKRGR